MDTVSLVIAIISAVLAVASAGFSCFTYFRNVIHDRRRDTLDAYNTLQNEAFDKLNMMMPANIREIAENPRSDSYKTISGYVARIEHFCAGVNLGYLRPQNGLHPCERLFGQSDPFENQPDHREKAPQRREGLL